MEYKPFKDQAEAELVSRYTFGGGRMADRYAIANRLFENGTIDQDTFDSLWNGLNKLADYIGIDHRAYTQSGRAYTPAGRDAHDYPYGHGGIACPFGLVHNEARS